MLLSFLFCLNFARRSKGVPQLVYLSQTKWKGVLADEEEEAILYWVACVLGCQLLADQQSIDRSF